VIASGNSISVARMPETVGLPSSSEMVPGMVARTQRLPSSSVGRNSAPRCESTRMASATSTAAMTSANSRAAMARR
jgi:hypothetical protein